MLLHRYNPISFDAFDTEVFSHFYSAGLTPQFDDPVFCHRLALMFIVLAIGNLMDVTQPAYNLEAEKYHQLARAALFQTAIFDEPTMLAVQTLVNKILNRENY